MCYTELNLESIIDDFFQPTFEKLNKIEKPKPKPTPINDVFSCIDLRELIFGFQKEILQDNLKEMKNNLYFKTISKPLGELQIGERYYDFKSENKIGKKLYEVIKMTPKSVVSCEVISINVPTLDDGRGNGLVKTEYYKYTNDLNITKTQTKRKTTKVNYLHDQDKVMIDFLY